MNTHSGLIALSLRYATIRRAVLCATLAAISGITISACTSTPRTGIGPGERAPEISGTDSKGNTSNLHDVRGKKLTLVNFWATWCGPCIQELPALQALHDAMSAEGVQVVGIVLDDSPESVAEFTDKFKLSYPMIFDSEGASKRSYEINGLPESFVIDGEGKVVMLPDPGSGQPVTKLIGPRSWESKEVQSLFRSLLKQKE